MRRRLMRPMSVAAVSAMHSACHTPFAFNDDDTPRPTTPTSMIVFITSRTTASTRNPMSLRALTHQHHEEDTAHRS